jgi:flagellar FliL protein
MKGKMKIVVPIAVLLLAAIAYKFVLAAPAQSKSKVDGKVYVLPKEFVVNLAGGRYAKLTVALVLAPGEVPVETASAPEGFGTLEQEPLVRQIVTDTLTGTEAATLNSGPGRHGFERQIRRQIDRTTDVDTESVAFTDLVVQ